MSKVGAVYEQRKALVAVKHWLETSWPGGPQKWTGDHNSTGLGAIYARDSGTERPNLRHG